MQSLDAPRNEPEDSDLVKTLIWFCVLIILKCRNKDVPTCVDERSKSWRNRFFRFG